MPLSIEVGGAWKPVSNTFVEVGGAWKLVTAVWQEVGGAWKAVVASGGALPVFQFVGSSTTAGQQASVGSSYTDRVKYYLGWAAAGVRSYVDGIGGSTLDGFLSRFATNCDIHYDAAAVNTVILQHGLNDAGTAAQVYGDLLTFCSTVKALHPGNPWRIVVIANPYPKNGASTAFNARVAEYEALYIDNPDFHNGVYADGVIWTHTRAGLNNCTSSLYHTDRFHMVNAGHDVFGRAVADELALALAHQSSSAYRPTVAITNPTAAGSFGGTITVTSTGTGADSLELWAGPNSLVYSNAILLTKIGATLAGNAGSWVVDTTQWPEGQVQFVVSAKGANGLGREASVWATITQPTGVAPTITTQPANQATSTGASATFNVVSPDATSYQWQKFTGSWVDVAGATSAGYTFTVDAGSGGDYRCVLTNAFGTTNSSTATLTVDVVTTLVSDTFSLGDAWTSGRVPDISAGANWQLAVVQALDAPIAAGILTIASGALGNQVVISAAAADCAVSCDIRLGTTTRLGAGLIGRWSSNTNRLRLYVTGTTWILGDNNNSTFSTTRANGTCALAAGVWHNLKMVMNGSLVTCYINGVAVNGAGTTVATHLTDVRCGLGFFGDAQLVDFDSFKVTTL